MKRTASGGEALPWDGDSTGHRGTKIRLKLKKCITLDTLLAQAAALKVKGFKPGFDGMTADAAELWLQVNGERLLRDLSDGTYQPMPAVGFSSAKKNGGSRQLSMLSAIDRIVQLCLLDALNSACETFFSPYSYAYRKGRGMGDALKQYCVYGEQFACASVIDIADCYDSVDHRILEQCVHQHITMDGALLRLFRQYVALPTYAEGKIHQREQGILQGAPLSPLLCNLYLNALDEHLSNSGVPFIRYADDIVLFAKNATALQQKTERATNYLHEQLKLHVNDQKSVMGSPEGMRFLGHTFVRDRRGMLALTATDQAEHAYFAWHQAKPLNTYRTVELLNDGVLRQKEYTLLFESDQGGTSIPIMSIDRINVYSSVVMDSGFLQKALENKIYINVFDRFGRLKGRFIPHTPLKAPMVTQQQITAYHDPKKRVALAKEFVLASIHNSRLNLYYHRKHAPDPAYDRALESIKATTGKIKECKEYEALLLLEASARHDYYSCFDVMIKVEDLAFEKRTRRPPENEINSMISYGNTVLYDLIAFSINKSPLDIRVGFLHATNGFRLESLQLDIAEIFKPLLVDRVILSLCNLHSIRKEHFERMENNAVYLTNAGKKIFLRAFYEKLDEGLTIKGRYYTYHMLIDEEIQKLVRYFKKGETYKAFRQAQ